MNKLVCKICGNEHKSLQRGFMQHISMLHKLTTLEYYIKYEGFEIPKCRCGKDCKYKSGLQFRSTCMSSECDFITRSRAQKKAMNEPAVKAKLREKRLAWMKANPEKTAWRLGKNQSWPEKFFDEACIRASLNDEFRIVKEKSVFPFYVDFAFEDIKVAVEIDGAQHKLDYRKAKDIEKDALLESKGWKVYRIEAHKLYSEEMADEVIKEFKKYLEVNIPVV